MRESRDIDDMFDLDDRAGPARPIAPARTNAMVAAALAGAGFGPPRGGGGGGAKPWLIVGGGIVVVAAIATALIVFGGHAREPVIAAPAHVAAVVPQIVAAPPPVAPVPAAEIELPAIAGRTPKPATRSTEDLLAEANAERAAHRWSEADAIYARVVATAPHTLASQTALVASASLHLEHLGDAIGAARRFRAALAAGPHGALAEDARWGLAEAARTTGDPIAERVALDDFLAHHASSPLAPRARERRQALP